MTGLWILSRSTALRTLLGDFSSSSSGVCTLTITSPAGALSRSTDSTQARELRQLTQSNAQNSTSTTLPLRAASVSGSELSQSEARSWVNSGGGAGAAALTSASTAQQASMSSRRWRRFMCSLRSSHPMMKYERQGLPRHRGYEWHRPGAPQGTGGG